MNFMRTNSAGQESAPEQPRQEPEIIPPGSSHAAGARTADNENVFVYVDREGRTHRVDVKTPGPFVVILVLLALALAAAVVLGIVVGTLFFLIPIAAIALASLIAFLYARRFWYRLRGR
jgi:hypothetical protein